MITNVEQSFSKQDYTKHQRVIVYKINLNNRKLNEIKEKSSFVVAGQQWMKTWVETWEEFTFLLRNQRNKCTESEFKDDFSVCD